MLVLKACRRMTSFSAQCSTFCPTCSIQRGEKPAQVNWMPSNKLLWQSRSIVATSAGAKSVYVPWVLVCDKVTRNAAGFSPELQPLAEDVCLHGLALFGNETKLRHQLRRVLQGVAVSQLTCKQISTKHNSSTHAQKPTRWTAFTAATVCSSDLRLDTKL